VALRNKTKFIVYISLPIVAGACYLVLNSEFLSQNFPQISQLLPTKHKATVLDSAQLHALQEKTLSQANSAIAQAEAALAAPLEENAEPAVDTNTWKLSRDTTKPASAPYPKVTVFSSVQVNHHPGQMPVVGEQVKLPMPEGETITANVESTKTTETGEYIWSGHLANRDSDYPIVMTYGETSTFATITTPNGSYTMEAINGKGTIFKNPSEIELSHPGATDFLEPQLQ